MSDNTRQEGYRSLAFLPSYVSLWSNKGPRSHIPGLLLVGAHEGHDVLVEIADMRIVVANHGIQ